MPSIEESPRSVKQMDIPDSGRKLNSDNKMIEMTGTKHGSAMKSASAERNKEEELAELRKMIEEKVEKYVPDDQ